MKRIFSIMILIAVLCLSTLHLDAQTAPQSSEPAHKSKVEIIEEESEGRIKIEVSDEILEQILTPPQEKKPQTAVHKKSAPGKMSGYRIQVFSDGRNQRSLEARARARGSAIASKFPKYRGQVYTFSKSPNWYTRIGNFRTAAEANAALAELRRAFPSFASEMRTVKCQIFVK